MLLWKWSHCIWYSHRQLNQRLGLEFPLPSICSASGMSNEMSVKGHDSISAWHKLPDILLGTSLPCTPVISSFVSFIDLIIESSMDLTIVLYLQLSLNILKGKGIAEYSGNSCATFSDFQEKMLLSRLPFDDKLLPRYSFPSANLPHSTPYSSAGLSWDPVLQTSKILSVIFLCSRYFRISNFHQVNLSIINQGRRCLQHWA